MNKKAFFILILFTILGVLDAGYLALSEKSATNLSFCSLGSWSNCYNVLTSAYAYLWGIPLSLIGLIHYSTLSLSIIFAFITKKRFWIYWFLLFSLVGFLMSAYLMSVQLFILKNICTFCTISALISFIIFFTAQRFLTKQRKELFVYFSELAYKGIVRPILFKFDSEKIHEAAVALGEKIDGNKIFKKTLRYLTRYDDKSLEQNILGIHFQSPVGLAAGFDYDAKLTQFLPSLNFGFGTVGTITNMPYEGNPKPRLGRLIKSKSLLVNKGFKSAGADFISKKLQNLNFEIPLGISIGRTNSPLLKNQEQSIADIIAAFKKFETAGIKNSYYELNISCPNIIFGNISFYPPENLKALLTAVEKMQIKKPIFIKMPISETNQATMILLEVAANFPSIKGVIFGNLQTNRDHPLIVQKEIEKYPQGKFSGRPTFERSNELIKLTYGRFKERFIIIGCGGIFSAQDAYAKIKLGASLVQLITGLIYEGPFLISKINLELIELLKKDGYKNVSEAIGKSV